MKLIIAIVQPSKLESIKAAVDAKGIINPGALGFNAK